MSSDSNVIEVKNLVKKFGRFIANDNLNFNVSRGEIFGFLGANGAGKTTTIRILVGLSAPTSGEVSVAGYNVAKYPEKVKKHIGYMCQKFSLYEDMTAEENILLYGGIYGLTKKDIKLKSEELLKKLQFEKYRKKLIADLPLGLRQKLAFAVAVFHEPEIVFLDEPTGGVDPITRRQFWEMIYETAYRGITIFVTTHYMDEAEYCDRISIMDEGKIVALDTPSNLKLQYNSETVEELFVKIARPKKSEKMRRFLGFVHKEFLHIFRDVRTMIILFGIPAAQIIIFGYAVRTEISDAGIAIVDLSGDEITGQITAKLSSSDFFILREKLNSVDQIDEAFRKGDIKEVVIFGENFGKNLQTTGRADITIIADGSEPNTASLVTNYSMSIINNYLIEYNRGLESNMMVIEPEVKMYYNPNLQSQFMFVPGIITLVLILICALMTSVTITREKEFGTMEVLLVSPLKPIHIILGKVAPYFFLSLIDLGIILLLSWLVFGLPVQGSIVLLLLVTMVYILLALTLGILISIVSKTMQQAIFISLVGMMLPSVLLSGFIFPIEYMPKIYHYVTLIMPPRWFVTIIKNVMVKGTGLAFIWKESLILVGMTIFLMVLSAKNLRQDYSNPIQMRTIAYLIRKEFTQIFRNKFISKAIFFIPIVQMLILVPAVTFEIKDIRMCIVDQDMSSESRDIVSMLQGSDFFRITNSTFNDREADDLLNANRCDLVLKFPVGFGNNLMSDKRSEVSVLVNAINATSAQLSWAYINGVLRDYNARLVQRTIHTSPVKPLPSVSVSNRYWYNTSLNYKYYMLPGVLVILVTAIGLLLAGLNVVKEKEMGTIEQINVTPIRKHQFIIAKLVPFLLIGLVDMAFGLLLGKIFFHIPFNGSLFLLFGYAAIYLVAVLGLTLFFSAISSTQQQFLFVVFFILMIFVLMSGIFTPAESMPRWAQTFNLANPAAYFMRVIRMVMLKGSTFRDILPDIAGISVIGFATLSLSIIAYRKTA